jgi:signal transduction histidine kinase
VLRLRVLRTSTFRFALAYIGLFAVSVIAILGFIYWATGAVIDRETHRAIDAEIQDLSQDYRRGGIDRLVAVLVNRSKGTPGQRNLYLLADPNFKPLAGNLSRWPDATPDESGWIDFRIGEQTGDKQRSITARARTFRLEGGLHLLVGRDRTERDSFQGVMEDSLIGSLVIMVILGVGGGLWLSRNMLARLDDVNRTAQEILRGDMNRRIPVGPGGDEFDRLGGNLNAMLDRIQALIGTIRQVTQNIAHDLRSPLTRMRSRLEATLRADQENSPSRETLQDTVVEIDAMIATFNALLGIAQIESGALRDVMTEVDLATLARDAVELYQPLAEERGLTLEGRYEDAAHVVGNRHLLAQAMSNLLDNAIKYAPRGGVIEVAVTREGDKVRLDVADNGPGIPADQRTAVLGRFVRLEASRSAPGAGLGLALVAAVADYHEADLQLSDNAPGLRVMLRLRAAGTGPPPNGVRLPE